LSKTYLLKRRYSRVVSPFSRGATPSEKYTLYLFREVCDWKACRAFSRCYAFSFLYMQKVGLVRH
jgi:hypothetical protein